MTPIEYYREKCINGNIVSDPLQLMALEQFQFVYDNLLREHQKRSKMTSFFRKPKLIKGLYLWGGIGIGKTFLMDCFYHCIPFSEKMRMHFHQFMRLVHQQLKEHQGEKDPLFVIAKALAKKTMVLCFDELFVSDITDAMLLGRLFKALFAEGVCLVATSNSMPDDLYKNGLAREQFIPAIDLIKLNTSVLHIPSVVDYRLRHLKDAGVFYTPNDDAAMYKMEKSFSLLTEHQLICTDSIEICGRLIPIKKQAGDVVWFDFDKICSVPRSQQDYLSIAEKYKTVFISDIPIIPSNAKDTIYLFISMVDVFYDARVRLVFSAVEPVEKIYSRGYMILEYARTSSRLLEMQSETYFSNGFGGE